MKVQAERKKSAGFILMLLISSLFASALLPLSTAENTEPMIWIVDDDDSEADFSSIQAAIDAAEFGDTVYVRSGHYCEHVLINKPVTLLGENKTSTVIDGNFTGDVVTVAADNVEISGFTIQNSGKRIGAVEHTPEGSPVYESMCGVYVDGCAGCKISGNVVSNNFAGLYFESCSNILISENQIVNNYGDCGILITSSSSVTLSKNEITSNNDSVVVKGCSASMISENQIVENGVGIVISVLSRFITVSKNNITGNAFHGLNFVTAYETSVFGNNISSNYYGIYFSGSSSNKVYENYMQANYYALAFSSNSPNNQAYNNELVDNTNNVYTNVPFNTSSGPSGFFVPSSPPTTPAPDAKVKIKILSPTATMLYQIGLSEAVTKIPLRFTVNEPVSWMAYSLDNTANVTLTGNTTLTISFVGSHSIVVYAKDAEGNTYSSDLVKFKVASTPSVSINSPTNATTYTTNNVSVNIVAVVPLFGVEYIEYWLEGTIYSGIINGTQLGESELEGTETFTGLPNGNYTLKATAHAWLTGAVGSSTVFFTVASTQINSSPSPNLSPSEFPLSTLSHSLFSFSFQTFSKENSVLLMSLNMKEAGSQKALILVIVVVTAGVLFYFKKRKR